MGDVFTLRELKIETLPIDAITPYDNNPRTHSDHQIDQIARSIEVFGWTNPILIDDDNGVIAGHGRLDAARQLGLGAVPCLRITGLDAEMRRALIIADNKLALNAGWNEELLAIELESLTHYQDLVGFSADELNQILGLTGGLTDPDAVPLPPPTAISERGDLWLMGRHRLLCGDSTNAEDVTRVTQDQPADFVFTSPPYAQQRDYEEKGGISNWDQLMIGALVDVPVKPGAQLLVNLGLVHSEGEWQPYWDRWLQAMRDKGWRRFALYVWDQGPGLPGDWRGRLAPSHELIFHLNRPQPAHANKRVPTKMAGVMSDGGLREKDGSIGGRYRGPSAIQSHKIHDSVFRVMRHKGSLGKAGSHPAVFPVALVEEVAAAYTKAGDVIYEPFSGSGTTIIAAERMGLTCQAIELAPAYCDVAVRRWQEFTGKTAQRSGATGATGR